MKSIVLSLIFAVMVPLSSVIAQSEQTPGYPPPDSRGGYGQGRGPGVEFQGRGMRDSNIRRQLEQIKIWQMTKEMNLPTAKAEKFFPLYNRYNVQMRTITSDRRKAVSKLDSSVQNHEGDGVINGQIKRILNLDDQLASIHSKFIAALTDILTPTEIARYMVFEQRFDREIRERIRFMMMQRGMRGRDR